MDLGIRGRRALLCGASKGLGFACAERLAEAGCDIVLVARDAGALEEAAQRLRSQHGSDVRWIAADLAVLADRERVLAECGNVDILVLSGGWPDLPRDALSLTNAQWHAALESMLLAQVHMMTTVVPGMRSRRFGRIVAVTSRLIKEPELELAMPSAARHGLTAYVKALSNEVAADNVTVNTMLPGIFMTETQAAHFRALQQTQGRSADEVHRDRVSKTPARRFGTPAEFSALCAYLCSRDAGFLTGQALTIDGGAHAGVW
jgi:3-oxoacyl-[acyl-carrier protein] reductase